MLPSLLSAGAELVATWRCVPATTAAKLPVPSAPIRATPLWRPSGFEPVTRKPKKMLPAASEVIGVLMKTVLL